MTDSELDEIATTVDRLLSAAGLTVAGDERERLIRHYAFHRQPLRAMRAPEMRQAEPALIFPALDGRGAAPEEA